MTVRRRVAFGLAMSDRFESLVDRVPGARPRVMGMARRYVAGESLAEAVTVARSLAARGVAVSLDAFGELVRDPAVARRAAAGYTALIEAAAAIDGDVWVSADLSHLGLDVSRQFCSDQLATITERLPEGMRLQIGAEDAARADAVLDVVEAAASKGARLTCTLQANLRRSHHDVARVASFGIPVRLVKGAFVESRPTAYPYGPETDVSYLRLARALRARKVEVLLATHDAVLREALEARRLEMLLGVQRDLAEELAAGGTHVRVYVPFGPMWFRYFMRRIAERQGR